MSPSLPSVMHSTITPTHEEIAECARQHWTEAGQPQGHDEEFWLEAERRLRLVHEVPDVTGAILATFSQPVTHRK
ncbi:MAG: DUF2934 domain-containing protein [Lacunisphaera sp.]